jgi:hypothetical protein
MSLGRWGQVHQWSALHPDRDKTVVEEEKKKKKIEGQQKQ